ncbi:uncharacterized protein EAF02_011682 [Botrytis sinoallii]|uniref:uncharacterized protein n=1 Tax=Botrytis sinoallii TaxID=1463999 RepID=UPI0019012BB5|nr:uncharacterized protein EAF02_011682 [Botrytis sinoallii]KAF7854507.1 hypothetical protein EAF02_011682 [Botrytis sinoallii]
MQLTMEEMYFRSVLEQVQQEVNYSLESLPNFRDSVLHLSKQIPDIIISEEKLETELQEDMDVLEDFKKKLAVGVGRQRISISIGEMEAIELATRNMREKWEERERMLKAEEVLLEEALQDAEKAFLEAEEILKKAQETWNDAEAAWHAAAFELIDSRTLESDEESLSLQQETEETEAESQPADTIT